MTRSDILILEGSDAERFWLKVAMAGWDSCWPWRASRHPDGHGQFSLGGRPVAAHRAAWAFIHGELSDGVRIVHRCEKRSCINPSHLESAADRRKRRSEQKKSERIRAKKNSAVSRFWANVRVTEADDCWEWVGYRNAGGYGRFRGTGGEKTLAHRFAYEIKHGPIAPGLCLLHRCDKPSCVNPSHLSPGTVSQNNADKNAKGRQAKGSGSGRSKLSEADVGQVRRMIAEGISDAEIAAMYGVHSKTIYQIRHGITWVHTLGVSQ